MTEPTAPRRGQAYEPPAVVYEAELEVRAGTPLCLPDPTDPLGLSGK